MSQFETNITNLYGERDKTWLKTLPKLVNHFSREFGLSDLKPMNNLTYNYVLSGLQDARPIVLKIGFDIEHEANALRAFEAFGGVRVLAQTKETLLLERLIPGQSLKSYFSAKEEGSIEIACKVIKKLHQTPIPQNNSFPHLSDWLKILDRDYAQIKQEDVIKARMLKDKLLNLGGKQVLLHGDLHHNNILQHGDGWRVIDPKGVIGDAVYDLAVFIRNPIPELLENDRAKDIIEARIKGFTKAIGAEEERVRDWCFVQSILSLMWAIEDGGDPEYFMRYLQML